MTFISPRAVIEAGAYIGQNVCIYGAVIIQRGAVVEDNCIVGKPSRSQLTRFRETLVPSPTVADYDAVVDTPTILGAGVQLHSGTVIYAGCHLEEGVICEDNTVVRWDTHIGAHSKMMVGAFIGSYIRIGHHCRVGGTVGNDTVFGDYVTSFGDMLHAYRQYGGGRRDPAPRVEDYATVGFNSTIIGGVLIGTRAYIAAGSIISKDVPPETFVKGVNEQRPMRNWDGSLKEEFDKFFGKGEA